MSGDVAQLGERRVRNAKVGSSILLVSTKCKRPPSCGGFLYLVRRTDVAVAIPVRRPAWRLFISPAPSQSTLPANRCLKATRSCHRVAATPTPLAWRTALRPAGHRWRHCTSEFSRFARMRSAQYRKGLLHLRSVHSTIALRARVCAAGVCFARAHRSCTSLSPSAAPQIQDRLRTLCAADRPRTTPGWSCRHPASAARLRGTSGRPADSPA